MNKIALKLGLVVFFVLVFVQCNKTLSTKEQVAATFGIEIPDSAELIKDKFHVDGKKLDLNYVIHLSKEDMNKLTASIQKSQYYYGGKQPLDTTLTDIEAIFADTKPVWVKTNRGYAFNKQGGGTLATAMVDTVLKIADFKAKQN